MENMIQTVRKSLSGLFAADHEYIQCPVCQKTESKSRMQKNHMVCPSCGHHFRIDARTRIGLITDRQSFSELYEDIASRDFLQFPKYQEKLDAARKKTGEQDAVVCGVAQIGGLPCAVFAMNPDFIMASMGSVVGEKITRLFEYATVNHLPVIGFAASGGARMQEGIVSLMQMAKVSGAVHMHGEQGNLYITVLTDPTTGGVTASFAMQGDIILAEPKALVGFAGRRVVEQTTGKTLPDDFQTAEFLLAHGFVDCIVPRSALHDTLRTLLMQHQTGGQFE